MGNLSAVLKEYRLIKFQFSKSKKKELCSRNVLCALQDNFAKDSFMHNLDVGYNA